MQTPSLKKSIASVLSGQVAIYILSLVQVPYLTRQLSPEGYGVFSFAALLFSFGLTFIIYGVNNSGVFLFRKHQNSPLRRSLVFWDQLSAQIILALIAVSFLAVALVIDDELRPHWKAYGVIAISFVTNALYNPWILLATERFKMLTYANVAMRAGSLALTILLVHDQGDTFEAVLALVLPAPLITIVFFSWAFKNRIILPIPPRMMNPVKVLRRDAYVAGSAYVALLNSYVGMVMAKFMLNDHDYGLLSFADRFRWISVVAVGMIGNVLFSRYSGERLVSVERGARFGMKSALLLTGTGIAVALAMSVAVSPLTLLLGGREFLPAQPVVLLVAAAVPFIGLNYYLSIFVINVYHLASRQVAVLSMISALVVTGIYFIPSPTAVEIMMIITAGEMVRALLALLIVRIAGYRPFHPGLNRVPLKTAA